MRLIGIGLIMFVFILSCTAKKPPLLLADREAPLGWVYLKLYSDSSFEFISSGLRGSDTYPGHFKLKRDTLLFYYSDSIPPLLKAHKAVIIGKSINYIDGLYPESLQIKLNKLKGD